MADLASAVACSTLAVACSALAVACSALAGTCSTLAGLVFQNVFQLVNLCI